MGRWLIISSVAPICCCAAVRGSSERNIVRARLLSSFAPIVQWIKQLRPKEKLYVRIVVGAPQSIMAILLQDGYFYSLFIVGLLQLT